MGNPRVTRHKKYDTPSRPFNKSRIDSESVIKKQYGLRSKKELWRAESIVRAFRRTGQDLLASPNPKVQQELFSRLQRRGFNITMIENILGMKTEAILDRRLQTIVWKRGLAHTANHARQLIVHGHIVVDGRVVRWPSYLVLANEEGSIDVSQEIKQHLVPAAQAAK